MKTRIAAAIRLVLTLTLLATTAVAQDPPAPPGGFPVVELPDQLVAWSDSYRTKMDLYQPGVAAPATGWPGVLAVHGGGGHRKIPFIRQVGRSLASRGYVVYAYDVYSDGETPALNPGWPAPRDAERVLLDSAESHGIARSLRRGSIDPTRLAVTGTSQGGTHALDAAAWSGKQLPTPGFVTHYPTVLACMPEIASVDPLGANVPGGLLANDELVAGRPPADPLVVLLDGEDYPGILAYAQASFAARRLPELRTSTVPLAVMFAWQDFKHQSNACVDALGTLPMPRRLLMSTGGHATPQNETERLFVQDLRVRWFDHYLKGVLNGVELETYGELAVEPDDPAYTNLASIWEHRRLPHWPPSSGRTTLYLRGNRTLATAPPPAPEVGPTIAHRVQTGFTPAGYIAQGAGKRPSLLYPRIPKVSFDFDSAPLPRLTEVFGRTTVELPVADTTGTCQITVVLSHVDPASTVHFITMGTGATRSGTPGRKPVRFDLADVAHVVPAGNRLRITVQNLADHDAPGSHRVRFVPYFTATDSALLLEPGAACRVHLPLRPYEANLSPRLAAGSVAAGIDHRMDLRGGPARAGWLAVTLLGASGEAPGIPLPGLPPLPLEYDAWTELGLLHITTPNFVQFVAILDARGEARPGLRVPAPAASVLLGTRLTFAGIVVDPAGTFESVFGPTTLVVDP